MAPAHRLAPETHSKPLNRQFRAEQLILTAEVLRSEDGFEAIHAGAKGGKKRGHVSALQPCKVNRDE
jgi:hypothetical protein